MQRPLRDHKYSAPYTSIHIPQMQAELSQSNCTEASYAAAAAAATASDCSHKMHLIDCASIKKRVDVPKPGVEIFIGG
jgi:hypothetical protein